jgi:pimeloyl-ACP methyl ester carboxylesterase
MSNSMLGITLAACLLLPDLSAADDTAVNTAANAGDWGNFEVGSAIVHIDINLPGTVGDCDQPGECRPMDVLLWYPADKQAYQTASPTVYTSRLNGLTLDPARWDPLSWTVTAERARDGVPIDMVDTGGPSFPLIIMSHAAAGEPHNYAPTLERLASHGYVIAAPWHEGDTQDDRRIDIINQRARSKIVGCFDEGPSPCLDGVQKAVQNRALDVAAIIDFFEDRNRSGDFGHRVDTERVGLLGQSRGSLTALAAAGGSTPWEIAPELRVKAIMTLAIGARDNTFAQDLAKITIPSLLVVGKIDRNQGPVPSATLITVDAFNTIASAEKALVILERAEHRVYGSHYCAQTQAAGAILLDETRIDKMNPRAIGERLTLENIILHPTAGTSLDWCFYHTFARPVDITPVIKTMTGFQVTPDNVPRQLDSDTAMRLVLELANTFFDAVLVKEARPGVHFKQCLSPKFLLMKEGESVSYAESDSFQGRAVECDDLDLASLDVACGE